MTFLPIFNLLNGSWIQDIFTPAQPAAPAAEVENPAADANGYPAHSIPNMLANGGFETSANLKNYITVSSLSGWASSRNNFELWKSGTENKAARDGKAFIEMDAERGEVSQSVSTEVGKLYSLTFDFSGRSGYVASSKMEILWNNVVIAIVSPQSEDWARYRLDLVGTGSDKLTFRSASGDNDSVGGLLDNVHLAANTRPADDGRDADLDALVIEDAGVADLDQMVEDGAIRNVSGFGNNLNNPTFATANQPFIRLTREDYGTNEAPRGVVNGVQTLPNERDISNVISNQDENRDGVEEKTSSVHDTNLFLMSFGQFFDHGLDFIQRSSDPNDVYYVPLRKDDPLYRFSDDGNAANDITSIRITRGAEAIDPNTGLATDPRIHTNKTSPFIDQNQTYGSSDAVTYYLRATARDEHGNVIRDADGKLVKVANLLNGQELDASGFAMLPVYKDILLNNGMSQALIDAAIAANDFSMLMSDPAFVDFRNVIDPKTGQPDGNPLLLDSARGTDPDGPGFDLNLLLNHYIAGDGRVNENIQLTPIHTIFHRDHDYWVEKLRADTSDSWSEEEYFQAAKSIIESEYQRVIFDEFIDAMAGSLPGPLPHGNSEYQPRVNGQISEEFAHAIYRVGHSMITEKVPFTAADGTLKQVSLVEAFLNPAQFEAIGVDGLIDGNTRVAHERIDENLVNAVRNQLLGVASDLAAINLARGREVGLASLNDVRRMLYNQGSEEAESGSDVTRALKGNEELKPYSSWEDFAKNLRDPSLVELFKKVYNSVDDVDLWIGGLAEKPRSKEEGQMGSTFTWIFWEQMDRLQDGDRFYYENRFEDSDVLDMLESQMFSDIIMRNSGEEFLNDKVFFLTNQIRMGLSEKARSFSNANETIVGNALDNEIKAGGGNDTVYGQAGNDKIWGGDGRDGLRGEDGNDTLYGEGDDDRLVGGEGNDTLFGGDEQDALNGNAGNDTIHGENGHDEVFGDEGDDVLSGGEGDDKMRGGLGNDRIDGGNGHDEIQTNGGNDVVTTGSGRDVVLMSDDAGSVTVNDFDLNHDRVDMRMFGISNLKELQDKLGVTGTSSGALLKIGSSEILLKGVDAGKLTMNNFKFRNDDQNLVLNGRMEDERIVMKDGEPVSVAPVESGSATLSNKDSTGWKNANDDRVEYQRVGGNIVLELDADSKQDEIYQLLPTRQGEVYSLSFNSMARSGASSATSTVEVLWNGALVATLDPGTNWQTYSFKVTGTGGKDKLSFREPGGDNDSKGALLDNVVVAPADGKPEVYELKGNAGAQVYKDITGVTEHIDGQGGNDAFVVAASDAGYQVDRSSNGDTSVSIGDHVLAVLKNVETIRFADAEYTLDASGTWQKDGGTGGDDNSIHGTDGDDWIAGTDGNDVILGGKGNDALYGGKGNDTLDGGEGDYNQVDLSGAKEDYTFTRNVDGTITVTGPDGTDTLKNIHGVWFDGAQEQAGIDSLISTGGTGGDIHGTDGDDWIAGTEGNDVILGGKGNDALFGGKGNDVLDGGEGDFNQVDLSGSKEDYSFVANADGTITVTGLDGVDTLANIHGVWFDGAQEQYDIHSLAA